MTNQFTNGADAFAALTAPTQDNAGADVSFSYLKAGDTKVVKVIDPSAVNSVYGYGIYKKGGGGVPSFVPENPPVIKDTGKSIFVNDKATSWDLASEHFRKLSQSFGDEMSNESYKYKIKAMWTFAFYDVTLGEVIYVDFSNKQAKEQLAPAIIDYKDDLDDLVFELKKSASGVVSLNPIMKPEKKLTADQLANIDKAPTEIDMSVFERLWVKKSGAEMVEDLVGQGFDISLIGLAAPAKAGSTPPATNDLDEDSDELPF